MLSAILTGVAQMGQRASWTNNSLFLIHFSKGNPGLARWKCFKKMTEFLDFCFSKKKQFFLKYFLDFFFEFHLIKILEELPEIQFIFSQLSGVRVGTIRIGTLSFSFAIFLRFKDVQGGTVRIETSCLNYLTLRSVDLRQTYHFSVPTRTFQVYSF